MSLSRTESRRRMPVMSFGRWAAFGIGVLLLAAFVAVIYVRSADAEYRSEEKRAALLAMAQAGLSEVDQVVSYTWDETLWIVFGKNQEGRDMVVWERENGIEAMGLDEGYNEEQIRHRFKSDRPSAKLIRMLPAWFHGEPAWEIRYAVAPGSDLQCIDFYSFRTGRLLKTYTLPGE